MSAVSFCGSCAGVGPWEVSLDMLRLYDVVADGRERRNKRTWPLTMSLGSIFEAKTKCSDDFGETCVCRCRRRCFEGCVDMNFDAMYPVLFVQIQDIIDKMYVCGLRCVSSTHFCVALPRSPTYACLVDHPIGYESHGCMEIYYRKHLAFRSSPPPIDPGRQ
jgi:hypothetical protein